MPETINRISRKAVQEATGKTWDEWINMLDREEARKLSHKEIAKMIRDKRLIGRPSLLGNAK